MDQEEKINIENEKLDLTLRQPWKMQLTIPMAIIIAGVLVAGSIYLSNNQGPRTQVSAVLGASSQQQQVAQPSAQVVDISKVKVDGQPFIGDPNAPVVIAYWYDYQCPFCQRNEEQTMPQIIKDYVDIGKAKIVFKDFQFLGPDSQTAGLAERAVWDLSPDKFYEWHKAMYDNQVQENSGWATKDKILAITKKISGIDASKVGQLMTDNVDKYQKEMDADKAEGGTFGVQGTPAFIIGKQLISGAEPYSVLKTAIDSALNGK